MDQGVAPGVFIRDFRDRNALTEIISNLHWSFSKRLSHRPYGQTGKELLAGNPRLS